MVTENETVYAIVQAIREYDRDKLSMHEVIKCAREAIEKFDNQDTVRN